MQHSEERLLRPAPLHHRGFLLRRIIIPWTQLGGSLATRISFCYTHIREKRKKKNWLWRVLFVAKRTLHILLFYVQLHLDLIRTHFTSMHLFLNLIISCCRVEYVHGHACIGSHGDLNMFISNLDCAFSCCSTSNDLLSSAPSPHYIKWFREGHLLWRTGWQSAIWDHCDEILMFNTWK